MTNQRKNHHTHTVKRLLDGQADDLAAWPLREVIRIDELIDPELERARIDEMSARLQEQAMPLSKTLSQMLTDAARTGETQRRLLPRGLLLQVKITNSTTTIGISRGDVYPSLHEWRATLNALPYSIKIECPTSRRCKDGRYLLYAGWPTPTQEQGL